MTVTDNQAKMRVDAATLLIENGFRLLDHPFSIGQIPFDVPDVYLGPRGTLSLAMIIDQPSSREESSRAYWLVQRIARALDAQNSSRSMNVILLGSVSENGLQPELQSISRVLTLDGTLPIGRLLAPLLRLDVIRAAQPVESGLEALNSFLHSHARSADMQALVTAARKSTAAVTETYRDWIDAAVGTNHG